MVETRQTGPSSRKGAPRAPALRGVVLLLGAALLGTMGCATYSDRMLDARKSADAGDYAKSVELVEKAVGIEKTGEFPEKWKSETALGVLERATLKQALGEPSQSQRDFQAADKELELLDIAGDAAGNIAKYTFSDSANKYSASPAEKLSLNSFNMLNYLAEGDLAGARVEARRFTVMRKYLEDFDSRHAYGTMGSYLAGFTMEKLGESSSAMRYYDEALGDKRLASLEAPVAALARETTYRGKHITAFIEATGAQAARGDAEILVVVSVGRVPHKIPERIPIGAAVGMAGAFIVGDIAVLGYTAGKFVVFPGLAESQSAITDPGLRIDGALLPLELVSHIGAEIRQEYESIKPQVIGAAISRMIVRAAAAEAVRAGTKAASDNSAIAMLAALFTEFTLVALDKPDTRSWIFLPDRVYAYRARVPSGAHSVAVQLGTGSTGLYTREVELTAGGFAAVVVTAPR